MTLRLALAFAAILTACATPPAGSDVQSAAEVATHRQEWDFQAAKQACVNYDDQFPGCVVIEKEVAARLEQDKQDERALEAKRRAGAAQEVADEAAKLKR